MISRSASETKPASSLIVELEKNSELSIRERNRLKRKLKQKKEEERTQEK
jgi:hypothetical protein